MFKCLKLNKLLLGLPLLEAELDSSSFLNLWQKSCANLQTNYGVIFRNIVITQKIKDFLDLQKLGYVATVSSDGKPNISPKGTIIGWTSNTLVFADIRSPDTIKNLQNNPNVEINVIDPLLRKGYLFQGTAKIIEDRSLFETILNHYRKKGIKSPIAAVVSVDISGIFEVTSPLYDMGISEETIKSKWKKHFEDL